MLEAIKRISLSLSTCFFHVESESGIKNFLSAKTKALERYKGSKIVKNAVFGQFMGSMTS